MASGPGVAKPRKEFHPGRQVSRQDWHNAPRNDGPGTAQPTYQSGGGEPDAERYGSRLRG